MKNWLDKYSKEINANESQVSLPPDFVGEGTFNTGRNYSPAWGGQFQIGGDVYPGSYVPQAQKGKTVPATRKDSLQLYNNSINFEKGIKKLGYKKESKYKKLNTDPLDLYDYKNNEVIINPIGIDKDVISKYTNKDKKGNIFLKPTVPRTGGSPARLVDGKLVDRDGTINSTKQPVLQKIGNNKYIGTEQTSIFGYNSDLPHLLLDGRIRPQTKNTYTLRTKEKTFDSATFDTYDPIAVKPFDLLTEKEKVQRVKQYGRDGVPDSYGKSTDTRKPNTTAGKQVKEQGNRGMVYDEITQHNFRSPITNLQSKELVHPNFKLETNVDIHNKARIPKYYNIEDSSNPNAGMGSGYGGNQSNYRSYDPSTLPHSDNRKIIPVYQTGGMLPIIPKTFHTGNPTKDMLLRRQDSMKQVARQPKIYLPPKETIIVPTADQRAAQQVIKDTNAANAEAMFLMNAEKAGMTREQYSKFLDKRAKLPDVQLEGLSGLPTDGEGCVGSEAGEKRKLKKEAKRQDGGWLNKYQDGGEIPIAQDGHNFLRDLKTDTLNRKLATRQPKRKEANVVLKDNTSTKKIDTRQESARANNERTMRESKQQAIEENVRDNFNEVGNSFLWNLPGSVSPMALEDLAITGIGKGVNILSKNLANSKVTKLLSTPIKDNFIQPKQVFSNNELPDYMEPYISQRVQPISREEEIFQNSLGREAYNKNLEQRTINYDRNGNELLDSHENGFTWSMNPIGKFVGKPLPEGFHRKIGSGKGIQSVIDNKGIISPSNDHLFYSYGNKPNENYSGVYSTVHDASKARESSVNSWSQLHGPRGRHKGSSPIDAKGNSMTNLSLEDPAVSVHRRFPFTNSYSQIPNEALLNGPRNFREELMMNPYLATAQKYGEDIGKTALWLSAGQEVAHQGSGTSDKDKYPWGRPIIQQAYDFSKPYIKDIAKSWGEQIQGNHDWSKQNGGIIDDDRGQWEHPGEITRINSNNITMQGVNYPVLGVSDTGDTKMMYPGENYQYEGSNVTEYPQIAQDGSLIQKKDSLDNKNILSFKKPKIEKEIKELQNQAKNSKVVVFAEAPTSSTYKMWDDNVQKIPQLNKIAKEFKVISDEADKFYYDDAYQKLLHREETLYNKLNELQSKYKDSNHPEVQKYHNEWTKVKKQKEKETTNREQKLTTYSQKLKNIEKSFDTSPFNPIKKDSSFIKEGQNVKDFYKRTNPNINVDVVPLYDNPKLMQQKLKGLTQFDKAVIFGHSGNQLAGIENDSIAKYLNNSKVKDCYFGTCHGQELIEQKGLGLNNIKNKTLNYRPSDEFWYGFNPNVKTFDEGMWSRNDFANDDDTLKITPIKKGKTHIVKKVQNGGKIVSAQNGLRQEQKSLQNLDNLLNFTNYNTPQPGGWLDKY